MFHEFCACKRAQLCPTLCNPIDCSTPGSFVRGNFLARILQWVAFSFSTYMYIYVCALFLKYTTQVCYLSQLTLLLEIFIQKGIKQSLCFSIEITFPRYSHGPWRAASKKYYQAGRNLKLYINKENKDL